ncbi:MAG: hypothetical protein ACYDGN_17235, partial [Acidimicrobiales bacterium]
GQRRIREPPAGPWSSSIGCGMTPLAHMSRSGNPRHSCRGGCQFDTSHAILAATVSEDLPELEGAVLRLVQTVDDDK